MGDQILLYNYFRSSASHRVRIAMYYKRLPFKYVPVHLVNNGGEQFTDEYKKLNPQSQVPCLIHNGQPIAQSMAILQYLEDICPEPPLFPENPYEKALVIQLCEIVNSGIQPLQNLTVTNELEKKYSFTPEQKNAWIQHWIRTGMASIETILQKTAGEYSLGNAITAADCFIVPQVFSVKRFGVDPTPYPTVMRVFELAQEQEAFQMAEPSRQPDSAP